MEQAMFEALNGSGVGVDNQTAMALQYLFGTPTTLSTNGNVAEEEEDLFQCGKCKEQFTSFSEFFTHKKSHNSVQLEPVLPKGDGTNDLMYSESAPKQGFSQPITLSESEFLSLSMDQGSLNIASSSQVLNGCDSYLPNSDQEQSAFQVQAAPMPQEVSLTTSSEACETFKENVQKNERIGTNTITVSVVGVVNDQISGDVRNGEIPKDADNSLGKIKCVYCGKSFTKNYDLQQHVRSHTGERPFQCVVCGRAFAQKSNVKKHMATHKVWPKRIRTLSVDLVSPAPNTVSDDTGTSLPSESNQTTKNINITDQMISKTYACQYCPALFKNYCELKSHRKVHIHQKVYRCIQKNCNETFSDLDSFLGHTQTHENEAQYHCHVCNKQFKSLDELGTHQYSHNVPTNKLPPRVVSCKKCKTKFANLEGLERHLVLDNHTYPCPQCGKIFSCERFLRRHLATHSSVLPYVCQHCSKAFKTEQYLNMHVVIHSNEKPFACQLCSAAFNRRDKLVRHNLIHENLRKFKCPFRLHLGCTKAFNRKDKLRNHMFTHSTSLKFLCENCGCIFEKEVHLGQHKKKCSKNSVGTSLITPHLAKPSEKTDKTSNDSKNVIEVVSNNMSTIEIVVVPVSGEQTNCNDNSETLRVTFPATKPTSDSVGGSQNILTPDQEVPVYRPLQVDSDL